MIIGNTLPSEPKSKPFVSNCANSSATSSNIACQTRGSSWYISFQGSFKKQLQIKWRYTRWANHNVVDINAKVQCMLNANRGNSIQTKALYIQWFLVKLTRLNHHQKLPPIEIPTFFCWKPCWGEVYHIRHVHAEYTRNFNITTKQNTILQIPVLWANQHKHSGVHSSF